MSQSNRKKLGNYFYLLLGSSHWFGTHWKLCFSIDKDDLRTKQVQFIWSDNFKSFKMVESYGSGLYSSYDGTQKKVQEKWIQWKFSYPRDPRRGGCYERLVKSVKIPLKTTLGNTLLNEKEMSRRRRRRKRRRRRRLFPKEMDDFSYCVILVLCSHFFLYCYQFH